MLVEEVRQRLLGRAAVARCEGTVELTALIAAGQMPAAPESAFVVPMGFRGGAVRSTGSAFVQSCEEAVAVVLALRVASGVTAPDLTLEARIDAVIAAVAGWQPAGAMDVFRLVRANMLSFQKGIVLYQIEFATSSELRIVT